MAGSFVMRTRLHGRMSSFPILFCVPMPFVSDTVATSAGLDTIYAWIASLRLRTLPLACCGIVLGGSLAAVVGEGAWRLSVWVAALITAVSLQLLANLANDYGDCLKATDSPERVGPKRGMQMGLILPTQMRKALGLMIALTILSGSTLLALACHSFTDVLFFLGLGALSIVAAITYTVGRHAYGYHSLGDVSVLVFFGWVSVMGSFYLLAGHFDARVFIPATACGLLSVLVLNVNNLRDLEEDQRHDKITLAVRLGARGARFYHIALLIVSLACLLVAAWHWMPERPWVWLWALALPLFYQNLRASLRFREVAEFRLQLAVAVKINILALGGFAAGLWI